MKYGGLKFLESAYVKDVLSVLRWVENPPSRIAGIRVALLLPGIGLVTAAKLMDVMDSTLNPVEAMVECRVPGAADAARAEFVKLYAGLRRSERGWPTETERIVAWYENYLTRRYDDASVRMGDLLQLKRIASTYATRGALPD